MKKTALLFSILICFVTVALTSCGPSDSVYWEDWFDTEGYVEAATVTNERTGSTASNSTFIPGPHPENTSVAVRWQHRYTNSSLSCYFKVYKLTTDPANDIVDELVLDPALSKSFTIPKNRNFELIDGFIFSCDAENVYVVNNLYKQSYVDHIGYKNPEYRFEIRVNGMQTLTIDMDYKQSKVSKPY